MASKRTAGAVAGLAAILMLMIAAPASAQTGGIPGGTTPEPAPAPTAPAPGSWTVYKAATWYGPGFWGEQTACGATLTPTTIGVAHRRLPCGTQVTFSNAGLTLTTTVIDRGPFKKGYAWDLTKKTAKRVGFLAVGSGPIAATVTPLPTYY